MSSMLDPNNPNSPDYNQTQPGYDQDVSSQTSESGSTSQTQIQQGAQVQSAQFTDQIDQMNALVSSDLAPQGTTMSTPSSPKSPQLARPGPRPPAYVMNQAAAKLSKMGSVATFQEAQKERLQQSQSEGPVPGSGQGYSQDLPDATEDENQLAQQYGIPTSAARQVLGDNTSALLNMFVGSSPNASKIMYAAANPQTAKPLSPADQQTLATAQAAANAGLSAVLKTGKPLTPGSTPATAAALNKTMQDEHAVLLGSAIKKLVNTGVIAPGDALKMMTANALPDLSTLSSNLGALLGEAQGQATSEIESQYGVIPGGFQATPDAISASVGINVNFLHNLQNAVAGSPAAAGLVPSQLSALIMKFIKDPNDPNIPIGLKSALSSAMPGVQKGILSQYGINEMPPTEEISATGIDTVSLNKALGAINAAQTMVASGTKAAKQLPPGPEQGSYLNFLKAVATALQTLSNSIYAMQQSNARIQNNLADMQKEIAFAKSKIANKEDQEVKQKGSKTINIAGPLGTLINDIVKAVVVACAVCMGGPVGLAMALDYVSQGNSSVTQQAISKAVAASGRAGFLVGMTLCWEMAQSNPLMAWQVFTQSGSLQNAIADCGGNQQDQMIGAMAIEATIQIAVAIAVAVCTLGAGSGVAAADIAATTTEVAAETATEATAAAAEATSAATDATATAADATTTTADTATTTADAATTTTEDGAVAETNLDKAVAAIQRGLSQVAGTVGEGASGAEGAANVSDVVEATTQAASEARRAEIAAEAALQAAQSSSKSLKAALMVLELGLTGVQGAMSGIAMNNDILLGQIALIMGKLDSFLAVENANMTQLQSIMKKLLDALTSNGEWISQIDIEVGKIISSTEEATTPINRTTAV